MRNFLDAEAMAKSLRSALGEREMAITHGEALELVAKQFGCADWNVMAAQLTRESAPAGIRFERAAPVFRIFDETKAREFYLGFLGFALDWEHRFGDNFPLYVQVSRGNRIRFCEPGEA